MGFAKTSFDHCLLLRVGVIAKGERCLNIMRMLDKIKPSRLRLKIVGLAPVTQQIACLKFAGEMGVPIYDHYSELLRMEYLDLILEMTGDSEILADVAQRKPPSVGVLDQEASALFFDLAQQYEYAAEREQEISLATSFASAMLEASPDSVRVIDRNLRIINCNNSPLAAGGRGREDMLGKHCFEVLHGALSPCGGINRVCPTQQALQTRRPSRAVHEITGGDGQVHVCHVTIYPLFNRLGEIVQFVEVIRDFTKDLSERIEQTTRAIHKNLAQVAQEDRMASLGRLVASVCHEINNPISSIVTFNKLILSYLKDQTMPPDGLNAFRRYLELSVKEALRCGDIVKNLLTFARQRKIQPRHIDIAEIIHTIIMLATYQLEMAGVQYQIRLPDSPFQAWGDYALIQQCLMNLIFNAVDAMPKGGRITISGGYSDSGGQVWLTISDTGYGIHPDDLPRIFEPFYSTKEIGKGVGLGLSMVYGIIREHNGTVVVESEPDKGTAFRITLPTQPPVGQADQEDRHGAFDADLDRR